MARQFRNLARQFRTLTRHFRYLAAGGGVTVLNKNHVRGGSTFLGIPPPMPKYAGDPRKTNVSSGFSLGSRRRRGLGLQASEGGSQHAFPGGNPEGLVCSPSRLPLRHQRACRHAGAVRGNLRPRRPLAAAAGHLHHPHCVVRRSNCRLPPRWRTQTYRRLQQVMEKAAVSKRKSHHRNNYFQESKDPPLGSLLPSPRLRRCRTDCVPRGGRRHI